MARLPIAQAGLHVTGMDIMPAMLERARAVSQQLSIAWVQADCRTFHLAQQFRCVLMTGHAFQNLLTDADQHALLTVHTTMSPSEKAPSPLKQKICYGKTYGNTSDYRLWKSFQDPTGRWLDVWVASRFDAQTMIDHVQLVRKVRATGETWPSQIALRYIGVEALNRRLAEHGFTVVEQYGDWAKTPYGGLQPGNYYRLLPGRAAWNRQPSQTKLEPTSDTRQKPAIWHCQIEGVWSCGFRVRWLVELIAVDEESDDQIVHTLRLRKADRTAHQALDPCPELMCLLSIRCISLYRQLFHSVDMTLISPPAIGVVPGMPNGSNRA